MKKVCCYGTGVIGTAWGAVFLKGGCDVTFFDLGEEQLQNTKQALQGILAFFRSQGMLSEEDCITAAERTHYTTDVKEAVGNAEFIQENCPDNIEIKQNVLAQIEKYCPEDAIIASSTSGLLLKDITAKAVHPERVITGHPYNPVYVMPLVEIAQFEKTDTAVVAKAKAFYQEMGKEPVVLNKECPGFLCNRLQMAIVREVLDLVGRDICSVEDIDKAVVYGVGLRWGVLGQFLISHIAAPGGFKVFANYMLPGTEAWLEDMATWIKVPEGYVDKAAEGVTEEMANRAPGTGQTQEELTRYLTGGVLTMLKYHGKL